MSGPVSGPGPIGFIGLGNMGGRIARRLVGAGHEVLGFDLAPGVAAAAGVDPADSIADLVDAARHVFLSLPDSTVVEPVVLGEGGVLSRVRPGQVVVDLSTAAPTSTQELHRRLRAAGAQYLDAGVSGGVAAAEAGRLTLMVGGAPDALAEVRFALDAFAGRIFEMGGPGTGHATKLLNNFLNAVNLAASSEVLVAAAKTGLDVSRVLEVINASSGANWATQNRFPSIVRGDYLEGGLTSRLMLKDVLLYLEHVTAVGAPSLNTSGPVASFGAAVHAGYGDLISNRVVDALGDLAGDIRIHQGTVTSPGPTPTQSRPQEDAHE